MIISSEITGKIYDTVEDCIAAEREFKAKEREKKEAEKKHKEKLDKAYEEAIAACDKYLELAGIKVEEKEINSVDKLIEEFFKLF